MNPEDWKPVYLTDSERAVIASTLIVRAENKRELGDEAKAKHLYYLAGLITFATSPEVRAA